MHHFPYERSRYVWTRPHRCKSLCASITAACKVSLRQVWALIQPHIRETRKTAQDPFGHQRDSTLTYTTRTHKHRDLLPSFCGRASTASCFGTSAEKVPLHISSGKQAEQMLHAQFQNADLSLRLAPHLTGRPAPARYSHYGCLQWQTRLWTGSEPPSAFSETKPGWFPLSGLGLHTWSSQMNNVIYMHTHSFIQYWWYWSRCDKMTKAADRTHGEKLLANSCMACE